MTEISLSDHRSSTKRVLAVWVLFGAVSSLPAYASTVFTGVASGKGAGIGSSNILLTIQNTGTEQGCLAWNGSADVIGSAGCQAGLSPAVTGGDEKTGNSQTQTQTVSATGVLSGQTLVIVLNVSEPGGTLFTVENISLSVFSPTGTVLFNSGNMFNAGTPPGGGVTINSSFQGQGNLGFAFTLDSSQANAIDPFICTNGAIAGCQAVSASQLVANAGNRFGISAILTNTQGGNETFSIADFSNVAITVPEPATTFSVAAGLLLLGLVSKLRRRPTLRAE